MVDERASKEVRGDLLDVGLDGRVEVSTEEFFWRGGVVLNDFLEGR